MDPTCWKILGGMSTAILALCAVIKILWGKLEIARTEIVELHKQKVRELEEFKRMVEKKP
jgi:hypothetical protein